METRVVEVDGKEQKSSVHITKCRSAKPEPLFWII